MQPFLIVGMPRTGSTLLLRTLAQHPQVTAYGEVFHWMLSERASTHALRKNGACIAYDTDSNDPIGFLRAWVWGSGHPDSAVVGCKVFARHAVEDSSPALFGKILESFPALRVLHVLRPNYLDVLISWKSMQMTGEWVLPEGGHSRVKEQPSFRLDSAQCEQFFQEMEAADAFFQQAFPVGASLKVEYEQLARDLQGTMNEVFAHLGVLPVTVSAPIRKQRERSASELVVNYAELQVHFQGTKYQHFFDESVSERHGMRTPDAGRAKAHASGSGADVAEARLYFSEVVSDESTPFTESRSVACKYALSGARQVLALQLPDDLRPLTGLRLDLANCPAVLALHAAFLESVEGDRLWAWNGDVSEFRRIGGVSFVRQAEGLQAVCVHNDPQFELVIDAASIAKAGPGAILRVELTPDELRRGLPRLLAGLPVASGEGAAELVAKVDEIERLVRLGLARGDGCAAEKG